MVFFVEGYRGLFGMRDGSLGFSGIFSRLVLVFIGGDGLGILILEFGFGDLE